MSVNCPGFRPQGHRPTKCRKCFKDVTEHNLENLGPISTYNVYRIRRGNSRSTLELDNLGSAVNLFTVPRDSNSNLSPSTIEEVTYDEARSRSRPAQQVEDTEKPPSASSTIRIEEVDSTPVSNTPSRPIRTHSPLRVSSTPKHLTIDDDKTLREHVEQLKQQVQTLKEEKRELESKSDQMTSELYVLEKKVLNLEDKNEELKKAKRTPVRVSVISDSEEALKEQLKEKESAIKELNRNLEKVKGELETTKKQVTDQSSSKKEPVGVKKPPDGKSAPSRLKELEDKKKELEEAKKALDTKSKELEKAMNELDKANKELQTKTKELDDKKKEMDKLTTQRQATQTKEALAKQKELEEKKKELEEVKKLLDSRTKEIESKSKDLEEIKKDRDLKMKELDKKIKELEEKKKENDKLANQKQSKLDSQTRETSSKLKELEEKKKELEDSKKQLESKKRELEEAKRDRDEKGRELEKKTHELETKKREFNRKTTEMSDLQSKLTSLEASVEDLKKKNSILIKKNKTHSSDADTSKKTIEGLEKERDDMKKEIQSLAQELEELHDSFREDQASEFRNLKRELELSEKNVRILTFKLKKTEKYCEQLESEKIEMGKKMKEVMETGSYTVDKKRMRELESELALTKEVSLKLHAEVNSLKEEKKRLEGMKKTPNALLSNISFSRKSPFSNSTSSTPKMEDREREELIRNLYDTMEREKDLQEQLKFSEEQARTMSKKLSSMEQENDILMAQVRKLALKRGLSDEADDKKSEDMGPAEMKVHLDLYEQELSVLRTRTESLEKENEGLQSELKSLQERLLESSSSPKIDLPDLPPNATSNVIYEYKIKLLQQELGELRKKLVDREKENENLRTEVSLNRRKNLKGLSAPATGGKGLLLRSQSLERDKEKEDHEAMLLRQKISTLEAENERLSRENKKVQLKMSMLSHSHERLNKIASRSREGSRESLTRSRDNLTQSNERVNQTSQSRSMERLNRIGGGYVVSK